MEIQSSCPNDGWVPELNLRLLQPIPPHHRVRRFVQLLIGLVLYGVTMGLMVRAALGLDPWDVLHQGLSRRLGISFGTVVIAVAVLVLVLWIPLRQRPGIGTVANAVVIGVVTDLTLALIPQVHALGWRIPLLVAGVGGNALAGALYIGAGLGPGPRDGLMTGLVARFGDRFRWASIRLVRTAIEVSVLVVGWLLGGSVGVGTVLYAVSIGPLLHLLLPRLAINAAAPNPAASDPEASDPAASDPAAVVPARARRRRARRLHSVSK